MYSRVIALLVGLMLLFGSFVLFVESGVSPMNPFTFLLGVIVGMLGEYCIYKAFCVFSWYD